MQDDQGRFQLNGLEYLDYWLQCVHAFTASYCSGAAAAADASSAGDLVGRLSPAVFIVGINRSSLHDDINQQHIMVHLYCCDSCRCLLANCSDHQAHIIQFWTHCLCSYCNQLICSKSVNLINIYFLLHLILF